MTCSRMDQVHIRIVLDFLVLTRKLSVKVTQSRGAVGCWILPETQMGSREEVVRWGFCRQR